LARAGELGEDRQIGMRRRVWDDGPMITVFGGMALVVLLLLAAWRLGYLGGKRRY